MSKTVSNNRRLVDPFKAARDDNGAAMLRLGDEAIPMLVRYSDVRAAAKDWRTYSSNAPFRVPIPSEEKERSVRQLPIEVDPPRHAAYRALLEPFFRRPSSPAYVQRLDALVCELLSRAAQKPEIEIVRGFALPLQSRALAYLLDMEESDADIWIDWGVHVFRDGANPAEKGAVLENYLREQLQSAQQDPSRQGFFKALTQMTIDGRPLTDEEALGLANLTFAGGRDTVINVISVIVAYFANHRGELIEVAADPRRTNLAVEEFVRAVSPLTHIGRVCAETKQVGPAELGPGARVSLCWAGANYDPAVFVEPEDIRLNRAPNPHVGFGSGHHSCLGALQARAVFRSLIRGLAQHTSSIDVRSAEPNVESFGVLSRQVGYKKVYVTAKA